MDIKVNKKKLFDGLEQMEIKILALWQFEIGRTGKKGMATAYYILFDGFFKEHRKLLSHIRVSESAERYGKSEVG